MVKLEQPALLAQLARLMEGVAPRRGGGGEDASAARRPCTASSPTCATADALLREAKRSREDGVATVRRRGGETLPALEAVLDALLHNALLDAQEAAAR